MSAAPQIEANVAATPLIAWLITRVSSRKSSRGRPAAISAAALRDSSRSSSVSSRASGSTAGAPSARRACRRNSSRARRARSSAAPSSRPSASKSIATAAHGAWRRASARRRAPSAGCRSFGPVIAKVEPLTPARALRGPFDYLLAGPMERVDVGSMLVVPFGRRRMLGVVVGVAEESELPAARLTEPIAALEADVPASLVRLGLWVAREYVSTPARGLALVLPPGTGVGSARPLIPKRALRAAVTPAGETAVAGSERLGPRQRAALELLGGGPLSAATLARRAGCDHSTLRSLERRGLLRLDYAAAPPRRPSVEAVGARATRVELTGAQRAAVDTIEARLDDPVGKPLLLHGVTGSGKTEVYLRAVAAVLERGRSAIVLVPEIALTPQTAGRFVERFGESVAIMHSRLSARERYDEWWRMRRREARVCVGPRSAVFAPFADLGLIVVDEEHDGSYKQEGDPRYDARTVAERRAVEEGVLLVAGSATPRPESALRYERLGLPERVDGRGLPPVELCAIAGAAGPLHERTRQALSEVRR